MRIPGNVTILGGGQIVNGRMENLAAAPGAPVNGLFYFDTTLGRGRYYNGAWVDFGDIVDGSVTLAKLAANSVDASKIVDGSVGTAELANLGVTLGKMAADSVDASKIVDGSITNAEIAAGAAIAKAKLAALNIVDADVAAGAAIAKAKLAALNIVNADVAAGAAITYAKLTLANSIVNNDIAAGAAIALSKLATDPLARANHTGTQLRATISDFDAGVMAIRLDQHAAPTANVNINNQRLISVADPVNPQDAATKNYVDLARQGIRLKPAVKVAVGAPVNLAAPGANLDGVAMNAGDYFLAMAQADATTNGIYVWNGAAAAATRAPEADTAAELTDGTTTFVQEGTFNATTWAQVNPLPNLATAQSWIQQGAAVNYLAGNGLTLVGSTFAVGALDATIVSAAGGIRVGVIQTANIAAGAVTSTEIADGTIVNADIAAGAAIAVTKIAGANQKRLATIGDGVASTFVVNHALNTQDVQVQVSDAAAPFQVVYPDIERTDANNVTIRFNGYVPAVNSFRVNIQG